MKCPKCGYEQTGTKECEACGLIFEKYRRYQEMREKGQIPSPSTLPSSKPGNAFRWIGPLVLCLLLIGAFLFFKGGGRPASKPDQEPPAESSSLQVNAADVFEGLDIASQLEKTMPPGNKTEKARNATVLLETPWGQGAGFFIDEKCTVVTNRHVVRPSAEVVAEFETMIAKAKAEAERIEKDIQYAREVYQKVERGEGKLVGPVSTLEELWQKIVTNEEKLSRLVRSIQEKEEELERNRVNSDLSLVLADGTKLMGRVDYVSEENDLAVVKLTQNARCPAIPTGDSKALSQGDNLFTIGSPMGLRHVVTSGVFSGNLEIDGHWMLQTDAPINPGNSGGPLIDREGRVVGINTLVMGAAQGIGFAIPIETTVKLLSAGAVGG